MNATYAKQSFTSKTISEVLSYSSIRCKVKYTKEKDYLSEWHKLNEYSIMLQPKIDM